ncbi:hypothetical protein MNBD_GAMMA08-1091 [hydrothermal vent metagenome]|uniref:Response regulator n=1 Tax=hydrothermal vent metagenome TaxID=652676 RepID=A0A3B0X4A0_9ZZZZ
MINTKKILLVDDDGLVLSTFGKGLKDNGYAVVMADNGQAAVDIAWQDEAIDLAILDMRMPGLSGAETAKLLAPLGVPVVFLSAYGEEESVKQAIAEGALAYMVKPIDVEKAIPTIEAALQSAVDIKTLNEAEKRLQGALETGNQVNVVVGILMEQYKINRQDAFELIRKKARTEQRKVKDIADEMLLAWHELNACLL